MSREQTLQAFDLGSDLRRRGLVVGGIPVEHLLDISRPDQQVLVSALTSWLA
ncbi:hypothetical protein B0T17DRAFT_535726 [Bombardia bombarda]|uniref:Uncharacterized protein n=1 Tax=Bombardia bombarda TaxID=252184 RepID=A0AA40C1Z4_9PEZI|nr:hypothetical protein B0T17DRAFT_535726 [Bombardia bombarda]